MWNKGGLVDNIGGLPAIATKTAWPEVFRLEKIRPDTLD